MYLCLHTMLHVANNCVSMYCQLSYADQEMPRNAYVASYNAVTCAASSAGTLCMLVIPL